MTENATSDRPLAVLIAGIGGGSLGLEIFKSLKHAGGYQLIGTDISSKAFGLGDEGFCSTYLLSRAAEKEYAAQLLDLCLRHHASAIAPGAEEVHTMISNRREIFADEGILPMVNSPRVVALCSDKSETMRFLAANKIPVPRSKDIDVPEDVTGFDCYPCVVKPRSASGGSNLVFIAEVEKEAFFFVEYLNARGYKATLQEYIPSSDEFTVGVLSDPDGEILGSIALKRFLEPKLSYALRYQDRVISSGWSQGEIDDFPNVCQQVERIARVFDSRWALNVQGRLGKDGIFYPFEVNPRHSGTTYLRALAGFNEPHILLQRCIRRNEVKPAVLKSGYYLRGFTERFIPKLPESPK